MAATTREPAQRTMLRSAGRFLKDFAAYGGRKAAFAAVFVAAGSVLEVLGLSLLVPLLTIAFGSGGKGRFQVAVDAMFRAIGVATPFWRLAILITAFGLLMAARALISSLRATRMAELQTGFTDSKRLRVAELLAAARWDKVMSLRHARISHLMSGDIQRVGMATHFLLTDITAVVMLLAQAALAFVLAPALAALAVVLLGGVVALLYPALRRAHALGSLVTGANLKLLDSTAQFLGGLKLAIGQNLQDRFVGEFQATAGALTRWQVDNLRRQTNSRLLLSTTSAAMAAVLVLVGFGVFHANPAVLMVLIVVISRMSAPIDQLQLGAQSIAHVLPAYDKILELEAELEAAAEPRAGNDAMPLPDTPIIFENVSFEHPGDDGGASPRYGVRNLSLTVRPGEFVGIMGPTGAGKTTFADLLVGLVKPQSGVIRVGAVPLGGRALAPWRNAISYVSQDPFLFHDTVRRNLSWANPEAGEDDIWSALRLTGAEARVRGMENGLDTIVGERGILVSGGERQRIALARAVLRKPRLMILDEATSAIDPAGEREVIASLLALTPRPTIVMIAHRRETLARCDRVLVMENGRLREKAAASGPEKSNPGGEERS